MMANNRADRFACYKIVLIAPVILLISLGCSGQPKFQSGKEKRIEHSQSKKADYSKITKEFNGVRTVDVSTVSGNCQIMRGDDSHVRVSLTYRYKPAGSFEPVFEQEGNVLKLKENMTDSNSGYSDWVLSVPDQTNILFESASGTLSIDGISGKMIAHTASGTINASNVVISGSSEFTSASGSVSLKLSDSLKYNVLVSSASGNASIDFNNNSITGTIEMEARTGIGEIECPFKFDTEKKELIGNQSYIKESVVVKSGSPVIKMYTASGEAKLKK